MERPAGLRFVCSDMWKPCLRVIAKKASQAIHVLDAFHIASRMNKPIEEVQAQETRELRVKVRHHGFRPKQLPDV